MAIGHNMLDSDVFTISEFQTCHSILVPIQPDSIEDAKLIVDIRSRKKGSFLKETSDNHLEQVRFLDSYRLRNIQHDEIYFKVFDITKEHSTTYNWITGELQGQMRKLDINFLPEWFSAELLSEIISLIKENKISFTSGKTILSEVLEKNISVDLTNLCWAFRFLIRIVRNRIDTLFCRGDY